MKKSLILLLIVACLMAMKALHGETFESNEAYLTVWNCATNNLPDAVILTHEGVKLFGYPKEDFKIIKARSTLFKYYFMEPTVELSQYNTLAIEWNSLHDHIKIQDKLNRRENIRSGLIGGGIGAVLTTVGIIVIKLAVQ